MRQGVFADGTGANFSKSTPHNEKGGPDARLRESTFRARLD
jgi:hypothetical protein